MEGKNMAVWFEIPVKDIQRAKKFYEAIVDIELSGMDMGDEFKELKNSTRLFLIFSSQVWIWEMNLKWKFFLVTRTQ